MTPYQLARQECSNMMPDGSCMGIRAEGLTDASISAVPLERCLLSEKPLKPCRYFEQCVLPLADQPDSAGGRISGSKRAGWIEARKLYPFTLARDARRAKVRACPDCGEPLAKRQRVCKSCQKKRRIESYRQYRQTTKAS